MNRNLIYSMALCVIFASCKRGDNDPGLEYSPQMYHSIPYEPLTIVTDKDAGNWLSSLNNGQGEFYNLLKYSDGVNANVRMPAPHTVRRNGGYLPYRVPKDSLDYAASNVFNPLDSADENVLSDGKILYRRFCKHCHGSNGQGSIDEDALVGQVYKGIPSYSTGRVATVSEGHIFHVITHGKGRMSSHGSQISIEERWRIVRYVQQLQKGNN